MSIIYLMYIYIYCVFQSIVTSVAESGVQKVVEETTKIMSEANEAVNTIVETASKTVVEEIKSSTTITEACSITKVSSKTIEVSFCLLYALASFSYTFFKRCYCFEVSVIIC